MQSVVVVSTIVQQIVGYVRKLQMEAPVRCLPDGGGVGESGGKFINHWVMRLKLAREVALLEAAQHG